MLSDSLLWCYVNEEVKKKWKACNEKKRKSLKIHKKKNFDLQILNNKVAITLTLVIWLLSVFANNQVAELQKFQTVKYSNEMWERAFNSSGLWLRHPPTIRLINHWQLDRFHFDLILVRSLRIFIRRITDIGRSLSNPFTNQKQMRQFIRVGNIIQMVYVNYIIINWSAKINFFLFKPYVSHLLKLSFQGQGTYVLRTHAHCLALHSYCWRRTLACAHNHIHTHTHTRIKLSYSSHCKHVYCCFYFQCDDNPTVYIFRCAMFDLHLDFIV